MSETAILGVLITACFGLVGVIYASMARGQRALESTTSRLGERIGLLESANATLIAQNARQEKDVNALQAQNTSQETSIAGLVQRMIAREEAHAQHREDTSGRLARIEDKLDRLLGTRTPFPTRYGAGDPGKESR